MRFLYLITDQSGFVHAGQCRSPDLKRREIAMQTGSAILSWSAMSADLSPTNTLRMLEDRFNNEKVGSLVFKVSANTMVQAIWLEMIILPRLNRLMLSPVRLMRRAYFWIKVAQ